MAATTSPVTRQQPSSWRRWVPWVLVVLAAVIALVSALNIWVKRQALDTNNFTNSSVRLLEDPEVRSAVSVYLVDQLYQNVNVAAELQQQLPPQIKGLAAPLAGALRQLLVRAADTALGRPRVQELWKQAVMRAHKLFIAVLDGKKQILQNTNGNVVLNLRPIIQQVEQQGGLAGKAAAQLPADAGQITILQGNQLHTARTVVRAIRFLSYFLFFLVLAIYALAVYLATGRRRQLLLGVGVSAIVVGLIVLIVRRFAGNYLIDALTSNSVNKPAVSVVWAVETDLLRNVGINVLIYGFFVVLAAWIAGPSRPARWFRRVVAPTAREHPWVIYGFVALVLLLILITGPTDGQRVYPLLVVFAFAFVGVEVLRRQMLAEFPATQPAT
jgi:hypothetical protein